MLEIEFKLDGKLIAVIKLENVTGTDDVADYEVKYMIDRGGATGMHKRTIFDFPRKRYNVFGLALQALQALTVKDLELERHFDPDAQEATVPTDLARGLNPALRKIQRWIG